MYVYIYIYRNSFGKQNCRRQHFLCKNAVILQKRRRIQKMTDLQMYVEATKCTNYTHFQLQRNYWQLRRNCGQLRRLETWITPSKNLQTRIAGAGLKTPGSFKRRLLPGKVAFFLKGNNKRAFGASRYVCMYIYIYIWVWLKKRGWIVPRWSGRMERGVISKRFDPDLVIRAYMDMNKNTILFRYKYKYYIMYKYGNMQISALHT